VGAGLSDAWVGREAAGHALAVHTGLVRAAGHALARALQRNAMLRADVAGRTCRSRVAVLDANVGVATILEACLVGFAGSAARVGAAEERVGELDRTVFYATVAEAAVAIAADVAGAAAGHEPEGERIDEDPSHGSSRVCHSRRAPTPLPVIEQG